MKPIAIASLIALGSFADAAQQADTALSPDERRMTQYIDGINAEGLALLERVVNINSGTQNFAGVREVG